MLIIHSVVKIEFKKF